MVVEAAAESPLKRRYFICSRAGGGMERAGGRHAQRGTVRRDRPPGMGTNPTAAAQVDPDAARGTAYAAWIGSGTVFLH
jgi:hypothetical protein